MGARELTFQLREGGMMSVAVRLLLPLHNLGPEGLRALLQEYFKTTYNRALQLPDLPCVEVGSGALIPLELCLVPPGQIMRKQVPAEKTKDVLAFATKRPEDRLRSIRNGVCPTLVPPFLRFISPLFPLPLPLFPPSHPPLFIH